MPMFRILKSGYTYFGVSTKVTYAFLLKKIADIIIIEHFSTKKIEANFPVFDQTWVL